MILDARQARRFYRLLDGLVIYANERLRVSDSLVNRAGEISDLEAFDVCRELWSNRDNLHIIDEYAEENPFGISRADLAEVRKWKAALRDSFAVVRDGRDIFMLVGDYAVAVRGITQEIDSVMNQVPGFAETVLIPFDSFVTYAVSLSEMPVQPGPGILLSLDEELRSDKEAGRVIRSARDFQEKMPQILEEALAREAEQFAHDVELDMNADELGEGTHVGELAGLSGSEREATLLAHLASRIPYEKKDVLSSARSCCQKGKPVTALADVYALLSKNELQGLAREFGVRGSISGMNKRTLVQRLMAVTPHGADMYRQFLLGHGSWAVETAKRLVESGGRIELDDEDLINHDQLPEPLFPLSLRFHEGTKFVCIMPSEVLEELREIDWDAELEHARTCDELFEFANMLVDLRGIVFVDELAVEVMGRFGNSVGPDDVINVLQFNSGLPEARFTLEMFNEAPVLVNDSITGELENEQDVEREIAYFVNQQGEKEPRPVPDELFDAGYVEKWVRHFPEAQDLMAYLDERVPDGQDDLFFAEEFVGSLIEGFQDDRNPAEVLRETMESLAYVPTEAQLKRIIDLAMMLHNATPKWSNNGWSPTEMRQR